LAIHTRLQRRKENGIYYCRVAIPKQLQHIIGKREIHTSLKTSNLVIARERVRQESYRIDQMLAKASGRALPNAEPLALPLVYAAAAPVIKGITFAELTERFLSLPERAKTSETTKVSYRATFRILIEVVGADTVIDQITRTDCRRVQEIFTILPANCTKRFPGLSIIQVVEKAKKLGLKPMNPVSANTYIMRLSTLMGWALREGLITHNPGQGLLLPVVELEKDKRLPFTPAELGLIFNSPSMIQAQRSNAEAFWIPMLSLWTGARLNELCQLLVSDIQLHNEIPCMMISAGEGKRLKTNSSQRLIPLHPKLIELGFLDYVRGAAEQGSLRLFPHLRVCRKGSLSDKFSKEFARYLKKVGAKNDKNCFHSFRHNFRDALRQAGIERDIVQALGGWKDKSAGTEDTYGQGHTTQRLYSAISKITYEGWGYEQEH